MTETAGPVQMKSCQCSTRVGGGRDLDDAVVAAWPHVRPQVVHVALTVQVRVGRGKMHGNGFTQVFLQQRVNINKGFTQIFLQQRVNKE